MADGVWFNFILAAIPAGMPLLLGTLGEILTEKSGHLNLGVEGMMFMGAIASIAASWAYEQMAKAVNPYGDGHACARIAQAIRWHFGLTEQRPADFCPETV